MQSAQKTFREGDHEIPTCEDTDAEIRQEIRKAKDRLSKRKKYSTPEGRAARNTAQETYEGTQKGVKTRTKARTNAQAGYEQTTGKVIRKAYARSAPGIVARNKARGRYERTEGGRDSKIRYRENDVARADELLRILGPESLPNNNISNKDAAMVLQTSMQTIDEKPPSKKGLQSSLAYSRQRQ